MVFWLAMVICVVTTIFYYIFAGEDRRSWDKSPEELEKEAEEKK